MVAELRGAAADDKHRRLPSCLEPRLPHVSVDGGNTQTPGSSLWLAPEPVGKLPPWWQLALGWVKKLLSNLVGMNDRVIHHPYLRKLLTLLLWVYNKTSEAESCKAFLYRVLRKVSATDQTLTTVPPAAKHRQKYTGLKPHEFQELHVKQLLKIYRDPLFS